MSTHVQLKSFLKKLKKCVKCPHLVENRRQILGPDHQPILPFGNPDSRILIIGQAPGRMKPKTKAMLDKPFAQGSGTMLNKMLKHAGLSRNSVFVANVLQCNTPANKTFTDEEIANCRKNLTKLVKILQPKVVVTLGKFAEMHINKSMFDRDTKIFHVWHPAFIQRKPSALEQYKVQWDEVGVAARKYAGTTNIMEMFRK